jgi:tetratricopeptide (TPR) repeat protein
MPTVFIIVIILGIVIGAITFFVIRSIIAPKKVASLANLLKQGKTSAVVRTAKQILAREPRNPEAHYFLGMAYQEENKNELALMELQIVNQIGTFSAACPEIPFRKKIAELYKFFNQPEEALKEYLLLIKMEPEEAEYYYEAGLLFEKRERAEKASVYFRKTIELNPNHSDAHYHLGMILYRSKKPVEAKVEFELAIKIQPDNFKAYYFVGKLLKDNHDYTGALAAFEKAQRDPEQKVKALVERGGCYMSMNNMEKAISELDRAVKISTNETAPETLYGRYFLAMCYEKTREIDKDRAVGDIYAKKDRTSGVFGKIEPVKGSEDR